MQEDRLVNSAFWEITAILFLSLGFWEWRGGGEANKKEQREVF